MKKRTLILTSTIVLSLLILSVGLALANGPDPDLMVTWSLDEPHSFTPADTNAVYTVTGLVEKPNYVLVGTVDDEIVKIEATGFPVTWTMGTLEGESLNAFFAKMVDGSDFELGPITITVKNGPDELGAGVWAINPPEEMAALGMAEDTVVTKACEWGPSHQAAGGVEPTLVGTSTIRGDCTILYFTTDNDFVSIEVGNGLAMKCDPEVYSEQTLDGQACWRSDGNGISAGTPVTITVSDTDGLGKGYWPQPGPAADASAADSAASSDDTDIAAAVDMAARDAKLDQLIELLSQLVAALSGGGK